MDNIDEKIEEIIEKKVEEKLEKKTRDEIEDSVIDKKIEEKIAEKVANRNKREKQSFVEKPQNEGISRRSFLKMLGIGAGGLALSSSTAGAWSLVTPQSQGTSDIKSSTVQDGAITSAKLSDSSVTKNKLGFNFDESAQDAVGNNMNSPLTYNDSEGAFGVDTSQIDHSNIGGIATEQHQPQVSGTSTEPHSYVAAGRQSVPEDFFPIIDGSSTNVFHNNNNYVLPMYDRYAEVRLYRSAGGSVSPTVHYGDGTTSVKDLSGNGGESWFSLDSSKITLYIDVYDTFSVTGINPAQSGQHNHSPTF